MSKFEIAGTCDICNKDILKQDDLHFADEVSYCPECFENAVVDGRVNKEDYYDEDHYDHEEAEEEDEG